jgi:acylpyruvate hydrolase
MRFMMFEKDGRKGLALVSQADNTVRALFANEAGYPGDLQTLIGRGGDALSDAAALLSGAECIDEAKITVLPPINSPGKIICVGLNYLDHSAESGFKQPSYPTIFGRFTSSLIGHGAPIVRPQVSTQLDYEGEFVAVIGRAGRNIRKEDALSHVVGYSLFNDASIRDYQVKSPQWTVGKNFDGTGAFGPYLVTADELPPGCEGLRLRTRLNGAVVQDASTSDLVFDVATLVSTLSVAFTLEPGDIVVTGTPAGVGLARNPQLWMKPGDVCEVELEGIGILRNEIIDQAGSFIRN